MNPTDPPDEDRPVPDITRDPNRQPADVPDITREPNRHSADVPGDDRPVPDITYNMSYEELPWLRKSENCSSIIVAHVVIMFFGGCIPFASLLGIFTTIGVIVVCVVVLTGPVYYKKRRKDGTLKTWSQANKIAAVVLLLLFVGGYMGLIYYLAISGRFG